jgi:hypothetical protein
MNRDEIFANYIRPKKAKKAKNVLVGRDLFFAVGLRNLGKSWLQVECDWQTRNGKVA